MRAVGILTTVTMSAAAVAAVVVGVRSLPDIQRYLKMRSM